MSDDPVINFLDTCFCQTRDNGDKPARYDALGHYRKVLAERDRLKEELAEARRSYETGMKCKDRAHGMAIDREYAECERAEKAEAERDMLKQTLDAIMRDGFVILKAEGTTMSDAEDRIRAHLQWGGKLHLRGVMLEDFNSIVAERDRLRERVIVLEDAMLQIRNAYPELEDTKVWHDVMEGKDDASK